MFSMYEKLRDIVIAIWLIMAFPAIIQLAVDLPAHGWQGWKQMFRGKRPISHPSLSVAESAARREFMQPASTEPFTHEQDVVLGQLREAVNQINEATEVLLKEEVSEADARESVAHSILSIARVLVISKAADWNMVKWLPPF